MLRRQPRRDRSAGVAPWTGSFTPLGTMVPPVTSVIRGYRLRGGNTDNILGSSRRSVLAACLAVPVCWFAGRSQAQTPESVMTRLIPHSGEQLPIVGLGTAVSFPSANESQRAGLKM